MEEKERYYIRNNMIIDTEKIINSELDITVCNTDDLDILVDLLNQQDKEIKTLKTKLEDRKRFCISQVKCQQKLIKILLEENQQFNQSQKELAIEELGKVEKILWDSQDIGNLIDNDKFLEKLNNQIKELKGEE